MHQVPLTTTADQYLTLLMEQGYDDPAHVIEEALAQMIGRTLGESEQESPERLEWMRQEVAIGAEQLDRGQFSRLSPAEIRAEVLANYEQRKGQVSA
ncbi:hypothetical protein IQ250_08525 [Pseudanabaenaceae cyanobacterium LEGE 13415]|nr:hypothetical protein [Pseudanabaenaceae cyanobacterium LEGE 13415]